MSYMIDNLIEGLYVVHVASAIGACISAAMTFTVFASCGFGSSQRKDDAIALRNIAIALLAFCVLWLATPARPEPNTAAPVVAEDARP